MIYDRKRAKSRRIKLGISIDTLASLMGVTATTIYRWEDGTRSPSLEDSVRIFHHLRIPLRSILAQTKDEFEHAAIVVAESARREIPGEGETIRTTEHARERVRTDRIVKHVNDIRERNHA
ncbi:helix-turn-helix domain-containing protein [Streptomyces sp. NPDC001415]